MDQQEFQRRTMTVGLAVLRLVETLPQGIGPDAISRQIVRSATSVGADYRASCRGKSLKDILAKLGIVEEEADETLFWLDVMVAAGYIAPAPVAALRQEIEEVLAMVVASRRTLRTRLQGAPSNRRIDGSAIR